MCGCVWRGEHVVGLFAPAANEKQTVSSTEVHAPTTGGAAGSRSYVVTAVPSPRGHSPSFALPC